MAMLPPGRARGPGYHASTPARGSGGRRTRPPLDRGGASRLNPQPEGRGDDAASSSRRAPAASTYRLARWLVLRWLGGVYFAAFLSLSDQLIPLFGAGGLLPVRLYLDEVAGAVGGRGAGFGLLPSLFWVDASDGCLRGACLAGLALSAAVAL